MRKIIHVDMDAFYASAELVRRPDLVGKPVAVGGNPNGRGVISTASYEARKFGVRSALSSRAALKLCPDLIFIRPDYGYYKKLSDQIRDIFLSYTDTIQPLSLDEAFLDVSNSSHFSGSGTMIAREIRFRIQDELKLTASAGVAPNKFLAKIASEWKKPDGLFVIRPEEVDEFIKKLPVDWIWGVGKKSSARLKANGFFTCGDLQKATLAELTSRHGVWGERLYELCRGRDDRPVSSGGARKSLSMERTFSEDLPTWESIAEQIPKLFDEFQHRRQRSKTEHPVASRFVKLKFYDFQSTTMEERFDGEFRVEDFFRLFEAAFLRRGEPVRLMGLGIRFDTPKKHRSAPGQMTLFSEE